MILIHGENQTGKSTKALSLLNKNKKSLYFALDYDTSIESWKRINIDIPVDIKYLYKYFECDIEFDIEYVIFSKGSKTEQIIVDPINFLIKRNKTTFNEVIEELKNLEQKYDIEVIVVMNTSFYLPEIIKLKGCEIIYTEKDKIAIPANMD